MHGKLTILNTERSPVVNAPNPHVSVHDLSDLRLQHGASPSRGSLTFCCTVLCLTYPPRPRHRQQGRFDLWTQLVTYDDTEHICPRQHQDCKHSGSGGLIWLPTKVFDSISLYLDHTSILSLAATCHTILEAILDNMEQEVRATSGRWTLQQLALRGPSPKYVPGGPQMSVVRSTPRNSIVDTCNEFDYYKDVGVKPSALQMWKDAVDHRTEHRHKSMRRSDELQLSGPGSLIVRAAVDGAACPWIWHLKQPGRNTPEYFLRNHDTHHFVRLCSCKDSPHLAVKRYEMIEGIGFTPITLEDLLIDMSTWTKESESSHDNLWTGQRFDIVSETSHVAVNSIGSPTGTETWTDVTSNTFLRICFDLVHRAGPKQFLPTGRKSKLKKIRKRTLQEWNEFKDVEIVLDTHQPPGNEQVICYEWHQKCVVFLTPEKKYSRWQRVLNHK